MFNLPFFNKGSTASSSLAANSVEQWVDAQEAQRDVEIDAKSTTETIHTLGEPEESDDAVPHDTVSLLAGPNTAAHSGLQPLAGPSEFGESEELGLDMQQTLDRLAQEVQKRRTDLELATQLATDHQQEIASQVEKIRAQEEKVQAEKLKLQNEQSTSMTLQEDQTKFDQDVETMTSQLGQYELQFKKFKKTIRKLNKYDFKIEETPDKSASPVPNEAIEGDANAGASKAKLPQGPTQAEGNDNTTAATPVLQKIPEAIAMAAPIEDTASDNNSATASMLGDNSEVIDTIDLTQGMVKDGANAAASASQEASLGMIDPAQVKGNDNTNSAPVVLRSASIRETDPAQNMSGDAANPAAPVLPDHSIRNTVLGKDATNVPEASTQVANNGQSGLAIPSLQDIEIQTTKEDRDKLEKLQVLFPVISLVGPGQFVHIACNACGANAVSAPDGTQFGFFHKLDSLKRHLRMAHGLTRTLDEVWEACIKHGLSPGEVEELENCKPGDKQFIIMPVKYKKSTAAKAVPTPSASASPSVKRKNVGGQGGRGKRKRATASSQPLASSANTDRSTIDDNIMVADHNGADSENADGDHL